MFHLNNVRKVYKRRQKEVLAIQAEDFQIQKGEYVAIVGPSGSGKTTLLSLLGGMLSPEMGDVLFDGQSLYSMSVRERANLRRDRFGFVFQTFNLLPYLTALENVQIPLFLAGQTVQEQRDRATNLLTELGLAERLDHKPCELSTGQQQRTALARTMANDPQVILADEPTGNLDPKSREHVLAVFDRFVEKGRTVVMVTHDPAAALRANRQVTLNDGTIHSASTGVRRVA